MHTRARKWWVPALLVTVAPALAGVLPAAPSSAAQQICVAVIVDFRALGGNIASSCATVPDGATGTQVLKAAGHTMTFRRDGLICAIDGQPSQGCSATDDSHYWSYWHRPPGSSSWQYSSEGAGTYQPANRSSEGWVWQNGGPEGSDPPPGTPESQICPPPTTAPPPATTRAPSAPAPVPAARAAAPAGNPPGARPAGGSTAVAAPITAAPSATSAPPSREATRTSPSDSPGAPTATAAAGPRAAAYADRPAGSGGSGGGFPTGLVVGVAIAVALGGAALVRARR